MTNTKRQSTLQTDLKTSNSHLPQYVFLYASPCL